MEVTTNNKFFKKLFLEQISRISDNAVFVLSNNLLECKACTPDNSVILGLKFKVTTKDNIDCPIKINVGDIKKLIRAFDCIEDENITFKLENNNITYSDKNVKFKYHLLENGIINQPKVNLQKLDQLEFDGTFSLTDKTLIDLIKASTFSTDSNKIYISSNENLLKGNLTDKAKYNVDSFEINVSDNYTGKSIENLCLNFEVFRILSTAKVNKLDCKISSKVGVVLFSFENNIITSKYIVSALTK